MIRSKFLGLTTAVATLSFASSSQASLIITGVIDGPITGGLPKAIEIYVTEDVADLSIFGLGIANNGGGSDGLEYNFPAGSASAGTFLYIASESLQFSNFFGFSPDFTNGIISMNGDDPFELYQGGTVIDVFGDVALDGTGEPWEFTDGWAYRNDMTGPDGSTFALGNWSFSGINALDGESSNATATTPFPAGSFTPAPIPEPASAMLLALGALAMLRRRR